MISAPPVSNIDTKINATIDVIQTNQTTDIVTEETRLRRLKWAMSCGGFTAFSLLYCVQPMMPQLSAEFALSAAEVSWMLSISVLTLVISLFFSSILSEFVDKRRLMIAAVLLSAISTIGCSLAQDYQQLLLLRALLGFALGGIPALAITYLHSETSPGTSARIIGFYIAGTALGGMSGRLVGAMLTDLWSWQIAFALLGLAGLLGAWQFGRGLPPPFNHMAATELKPGASQQWQQRWRYLAQMCQDVRWQIRQPKLLLLFLIAFLMTGCLTGMYNNITFRLMAAPYQFSQGAVGALSLFYLFGIASSIWGSALINRFRLSTLLNGGLGSMLVGLLLSLHPSLLLILPGIALFTFGFFACHTLCSHALASFIQAPKALVTAIYLCCYYLGTSLLGVVSGYCWQHAGWTGLVWMLATCVVLALCCCWLLASRWVLNRSSDPRPPSPTAVVAAATKIPRNR